MYKEYRAMSRVEAVEQMYSDMAARHRSRFRSVHILKVVELEKTSDVKRPYIKQLLDPKLRFPLPSRLPKQAVGRPCTASIHAKLTCYRVQERRSSLPRGHRLGTRLCGDKWSDCSDSCIGARTLSEYPSYSFSCKSKISCILFYDVSAVILACATLCSPLSLSKVNIDDLRIYVRQGSPNASHHDTVPPPLSHFS